jgi:threonine dehydratase
VDFDTGDDGRERCGADILETLHGRTDQYDPAGNLQRIEIRIEQVAERTFALTQRYVDDIVLVTDAQIAAATRWLWLECNQLVEPSGAAALAAALYGAADMTPYQHPIALICGGNAPAEPVLAAYEAISR